MATFEFRTLHGEPPPSGDIFWYKAHGLSLYFAFAVLFPLGVVGVRYGRYHVKFSHWFQCHWVFQSLGVFLATGGISIALRKFENCRSTVHGNMGFALAVIILLQPILAVFRPDREDHLRRYWEFSHWLTGTAAIILGWINIFKGLDHYFSVWPEAGNQLILTVGFSIQVAIIGFFYLLFDRCHREKPDHQPDDRMVPLLVESAAAVKSQFLTRV